MYCVSTEVLEECVHMVDFQVKIGDGSKGLVVYGCRFDTTLRFVLAEMNPESFVIFTAVVRGSEGLSLLTQSGSHLEPISSGRKLSETSECRVLAFSRNGSALAWCDGRSVQIMDVASQSIRCSIPKPKTRHLQFSPFGTYLALWEPYAVTKENPSGAPNLEIWSTEKVSEFVQKKHQDWCPQWSDDEQLCARNVTNEVHCFEGGAPGRSIDRKLQLANLSSFALSPGKPPYKIAIYVPGSKGAPSFVRLYEYPNIAAAAIVASKSFYRADSVSFFWNKKGSGVLVLTTTEVDKTGASYYGEQGLHYLSPKGEGNIVLLGKKGPIYEVEWNPNSQEFCVVYGFMPSKATLFNCNCDPIYDFGTGHRNVANFNPQGNILCLAGFGNLRGNMEFWNRKELKLISKTQASDSTQFEWCPDGVHVVTATTAPRLREGNGFKLWHFSGSLVFQQDTPPKHELWEVKWRPFPAGTFPEPDPSSKPTLPASVEQPKPQARAGAYRPPALRGKPYTYKLHEEEPPQGVGKEAAGDQAEKLSKAALKNKRKREAKQRSKEQDTSSVGVSLAVGAERRRGADQQDALQLAAQLGGRSQGGGGGEGGASTRNGSSGGVGGDEGTTSASDRDKKLKNLRKKLKQIEQLKQQQAEGKVLESNQVEKIKTEESICKEIAKLELNSC